MYICGASRMFLAFSGSLWAAIVVVIVAQLVKPPPLDISCSDSVEKVYTRQDTDVRSTCLWRADLQLLYKPSVTLSKEESESNPPSCSWYGNGVWFRNTTQWSGQETKDVLAGGVVTIQCVTSWCPRTTCLHRNLTISLADQDIKFFVLSAPGLIYQYEIVSFGWCAKMKSSGWTYTFSRHNGAQAILIPSDNYVEIEDTKYPPGLRPTCSSYYSYMVNASYDEAGQHVATLVVPSGPVSQLTISVVVEQTLLHVFSATSNQLSQTINMSLKWTLYSVGSKVGTFQLIDQFKTATWDLAVNKDIARTEPCSPPLISTGYAIIHLYLFVNQSVVRRHAGQFDFISGTVELSTRKNLGSVSLNTTDNQNNVYYFNESSGLYYSAKEKGAEAGSSTHFIFFRQDDLSFLFQMKLLESSKTFSLVAHMYLNKGSYLHRLLSDFDIAVHVFSSGPSAVSTLIYIVWFIPTQPLSLQCEWRFVLELYGSGKTFLVRNTTYTYGDYTLNAATYIPNSELGFNALNYIGFVAEANFNKSGFKPVVLKSYFGKYASKVSETSIHYYNVPCEILVFSIRKPKSPSFIGTTRGSHLHVSVSIQINCSSSHRINLLWRIYQVSGESAVPRWDDYLNLPQVSPVNQSNLEIPKFTLSSGFYLLNVSIDVVTAVDEDASRSNSDSVLVAVEESELRAAIAGGSFRTVGFSDSWRLDGGSSSDPDSLDPSEGLTFTWYCTTDMSVYSSMKMSEKTDCHPDQTNLEWVNPQAPTQAVRPEYLQGNRRYYFRLVVSKRNRTSYSDQTVFVEPGNPPLITVACIENCLKILIPTERFSLSGKCLDCSRTSRPQYEWSLHRDSSEIKLDWASKTTTGRHIAYLSVVAKTFADIADQWYTTALKVTTWTGAPSYYKYTFYANSPPKPGICDLKPSVGNALQTRFTVRCSGFSDKNLPLNYKVVASLEKKARISSLLDNVLGTIVYFGYEPEMPPSLLPVGVPSEGYTLALYVQVYDSLNSYTQTVLYATVMDYNQGKPVEMIPDELDSMVSGTSSTIGVFLETGDFLKAGHLIQMVASVLNRFGGFPHAVEVKRSQLRERLLYMTSTIRISNAMCLNQIITCISELSPIAKELTLNSQQLAVGKLVEATDSLARYRRESLGSVESESLSGGILTSLSNVMSASLLSIGKTDLNVPPNVVELLQRSLSAIEDVTDIVSQGKVPGDHETSMETPLFKIRLNKAEMWDLVKAYLTVLDCLNCFYPTLQNMSSVLPIDAVVVSAFYEFKEDPFPWLNNRIGISSTVVGYYLAALLNNDRVIDIIPETVDVCMERKTEVPLFDIFVSPDDERTSGSFSFEIDLDAEAEWYVQFIYTQDIVFNIYIHIGENITSNPPLASFQIPRAEKAEGNFLKDWNPKIIRIPTESIPKTSAVLTLSVELTTSYMVWKKEALLKGSIFNAVCLDYEEGSYWRKGNCKAGPLTDNRKVHCVCKGLQKPRSRMRTFLKKKHTFFATKVIVSPNPIDLTKATFRELYENFVTLLTVLVIVILYAPLVFKARRLDQRDARRKQKGLVLPDNDPYDTECYMVTMYTGTRYGSGTTADVYLKIIGVESDSETHLLKMPGSRSFKTGGVDTFLVSTGCCLGDVCHIRIWHNNSGGSPGWYLSRMKIENVFTKQVWYFICRKWLDINKEDGLIERQFFPADRSVPLTKRDFFLIKMSWSIVEQHLWLSIFASVIPSSLSRVRQLTCGFTVLLSTLLVNIAFYSVEDVKDSNNNKLFRSIIVGIEGCFVTLPVDVLVYSLFRYAKTTKAPPAPESPTEDESQNTTMQRTYSDSYIPWQRCLKDHCWEASHPERDLAKDEEPTTSGLDSISSERLRPCQRMQNNCVMPEAMANEIVPTKSTAPPPTIRISRMCSPPLFRDQCKKVRSQCTSCPCIARWSVHIAWSFAFMVSTVSTCLITVYGLSYGYETSVLWVIASVTSFVQNVFIVQFAKIILKTVYDSYSARYPRDVPWIRDLDSLENLVVSPMKERTKEELHSKLVLLRQAQQYQPLRSDEIAFFRKRNKRKAEALVFTKHLVSHLMLLFLVLYLVFSSDNTNVFHYNQAIYRQFSRNLQNVDRLNRTYTWLSDVFTPLIHNKERPSFLAEGWSKIVGLPRIRKVKAAHCRPSGTTAYSLLDRKPFAPESRTDHQVKRSAKSKDFDPDDYDGFAFEDSLHHWNRSLPGAVFGVEGYTVYFFPEKDLAHSLEKIQVLENANWLREDTWALVAELSTYNPDVHLFCAIAVVFEVSCVGVLNPELHVHSFSLLTAQDLGHADICLICFFCVCLLLGIADEFHTVRAQKRKYFCISNGVTLVLKSLLFLVFILTIARLVVASELLEFYSLRPHHFIPLFVAAFVDVLYRDALGSLAFCVVLNSLRYASFVYEIRLAQKSIGNSLSEIFSVALVLAICFVAFSSFGYLAFGQFDWDFSSFLNSARTVLSYSVSNFRKTAFPGILTLGDFYLFSFFVAMICLVVKLFQTVVVTAYKDTKQSIYEEPSDEADVVAFLIFKVREWWPLRRRNPSDEFKHDSLNGFLYGRSQNPNRNPLGLKTVRFGDKKLVVLSE